VPFAASVVQTFIVVPSKHVAPFTHVVLPPLLLPLPPPLLPPLLLLPTPLLLPIPLDVPPLLLPLPEVHAFAAEVAACVQSAQLLHLNDCPSPIW
jgi:hypothetical protein